MRKVIDLEITHEWLGLNTEKSKDEKKKEASERKKLKELKENKSIDIEIKFTPSNW
jgi:hypothetical protein